MLLVVGLLSLAMGLLVIGGVCLAANRGDDPAFAAMLARRVDTPETIERYMLGCVCIGLFLLLCAGYIWSHP